jgi:hypothetical protein
MGKGDGNFASRHTLHTARAQRAVRGFRLKIQKLNFICRDLADDFEQFQKDRKVDALASFCDLLRETRLGSVDQHNLSFLMFISLSS